MLCVLVGDETISMWNLESIPIALQMRENAMKTCPAFSGTQHTIIVLCFHTSALIDTKKYLASYSVRQLVTHYLIYTATGGKAREIQGREFSWRTLLVFLSESCQRLRPFSFSLSNTPMKLPASQAGVRSPIGLCNSLGCEREEDTEADFPGWV